MMNRDDLLTAAKDNLRKPLAGSPSYRLGVIQMLERECLTAHDDPKFQLEAEGLIGLLKQARGERDLGFPGGTAVSLE